jgi:hypothetical protein
MIKGYMQGAVGYLVQLLAVPAILVLLIAQAPPLLVALTPIALVILGSYLRYVSRQTVRMGK